MANLATMFDYKDGALYWKVRPSKATKIGDRAGSINSRGYRTVRVCGKNIREHRAIFAIHHGYLPEIVDHINGDKTDNRIENLRAADKSTNAMNSKTQSNNTSGVKGVSWKAGANKWYAQVRVKQKLVWSGYFETVEKAEQAVRMARIELHQEYANHG